ncbi:MAG: right-handed parallel beta-helix repeat-containing protein [Oligoflexus sp.]|nr:right-handed parallel beta-helix repeat-containing protein [Oligoflexus sp.]
MKYLISLILLLVLNQNPVARGEACAFKGSKVIFSDGYTLDLPDLKSALTQHFEDVTIELGGGLESENLVLKAAKNVIFTSKCSAVVKGIEVSKSTNVTIEKLSIQSFEAPGIVFKGGADSNDEIILKELNLQGKQFFKTNDGIQIQAQNKNLSLANLDISAYTGNGIVVADAVTGLVIDSSRIKNQQGNGILVNGNSDMKISNNLIQGNGRIDGESPAYGIFLQSNLVAASIIATNNNVSFNFGNLALAKSSDINRIDLMTEATGNKTTFGIEAPNLEAVVPLQARSLNANYIAELAAMPATQRNLLNQIGAMVELAIETSDVTSDRFAFIRQQQAEACLFQTIGKAHFSEVMRLLTAMTGNDFSKIKAFVARYKGVHKFDAVQIPTPELCEKLKS